ncbi:hypothetical protein DPX39_000067000 [Trypanosoma brucei equiperdum]|uniref:Uncharacterized protein n=1 Tax=Trypanosoma brucei equiperdum TaxID=630700 RepID=A0A3L6KS13_9TRYP|nr:hypothetical protein DPX39_000067000 [Trypanosoma brucei equiperdum]
MLRKSVTLLICFAHWEFPLTTKNA